MLPLKKKLKTNSFECARPEKGIKMCTFSKLNSVFLNILIPNTSYVKKILQWGPQMFEKWLHFCQTTNRTPI